MSHVARVDLVVKNLSDLKAAVTALGGELHEGQSEWKWYGRWVNDFSRADAAYHHGINPERYGKEAAHVISHPKASYEIGVYANPDTKAGGYVLVYDNFSEGKGLEKAFGAGLVTLKTEYGCRVAIRHATRLGMSAKRTVDAKTGRQQVILTK